MRKMRNYELVAGYLYDAKLQSRVVENTASKVYGKEYISGSVDIATDDDLLNVITIRYGFVTSDNKNYNVLKQIMENGETVLKVGADRALKVSASTSLLESNFPSRQTGEMISAKQNDGGFINIVNELPDGDRNKFEVDILACGLREVEADPDRNIDFHAILKGYVFNFRNEAQYVELVVKNQDAINYFAGFELSDSAPILTKVAGEINSTTIVKKTEEAGAFGGPSVRTTTRTLREWLVTWAQAEPYELGPDGAMTKEDMDKCLGDREVRIAEAAARRSTTQAPTQTASFTTPVAKKGGFSF